MPFIENKNRDRIKLLGCEASESVGDLCYVFYSQIMIAWRDNPRWRTIHRLFREYHEQPEANEFFTYVYEKVMNKFELDDVACASKLAFKVFWDRYAYDYEIQQMEKKWRHLKYSFLRLRVQT